MFRVTESNAYTPGMLALLYFMLILEFLQACLNGALHPVQKWGISSFPVNRHSTVAHWCLLQNTILSAIYLCLCLAHGPYQCICRPRSSLQILSSLLLSSLRTPYLGCNNRYEVRISHPQIRVRWWLKNSCLCSTLVSRADCVPGITTKTHTHKSSTKGLLQ